MTTNRLLARISAESVVGGHDHSDRSWEDFLYAVVVYFSGLSVAADSLFIRN